jgi:hypothetical protein
MAGVLSTGTAEDGDSGGPSSRIPWWGCLMIGIFSVVIKCGYSVTGCPYAKKGLIDLKTLNSFTCSGGRGGFRAGRTHVIAGLLGFIAICLLAANLGE